MPLTGRASGRSISKRQNQAPASSSGAKSLTAISTVSLTLRSLSTRVAINIATSTAQQRNGKVSPAIRHAQRSLSIASPQSYIGKRSSDIGPRPLQRIEDIARMPEAATVAPNTSVIHPFSLSRSRDSVADRSIDASCRCL